MTQPNISTSSDEQYRIQKAINGNNGVTKQDALDEEIDNGIDEEASNINITFENQIFRKIHNNGIPMSSEDRKNSLTLDGRSKLNKKKKTKGRYGIGGFNSRCCLAGQGEQVMTTKDGEDAYQVKINLEKLQDENLCPTNCWTGSHQYRPKWFRLENSLNFEQGVTKEYNGENLKLKFDLHELVQHLCIKYNKEIKKGLNININWDRNIYQIPDIYNFEYDTYEIDAYDFDGHLEYYCDYHKTNIKSTYKQLRKDFKSGRPSSSKKKGSYKFNIGYPRNYNTQLVTDKDLSNSSISGYVGKEYININTENVFKNIEEAEIEVENEEKNLTILKTMRLICGQNYIDYTINESKKEINNFSESVLEKFLPDIRINMNGSTLSCPVFDRKNEFSSGGDLGNKLVYKIFDIEINYDSSEKNIDLSQEDKNKVQIPKHLAKIIGYIIKLKQDEINKKLFDSYKKAQEVKMNTESSNSLDSNVKIKSDNIDPESVDNLEAENDLESSNVDSIKKISVNLESELESNSNINVDPDLALDSDSNSDDEPEIDMEPVDVRSHRRGTVNNKELYSELNRVINIIDKNEDNKQYTNKWVTLYNLLTEIK